MKKVLMTILAFILMLTFTACSENNEDPANTEKPAVTEKPQGNEKLEGTLEELIEQIYEGTDLELPELANNEVNEENSKYYTGVENLDFEEALASEPVINPGAHSLVLIRMPDGTDIEKAKENILEGSDPMKWVCVGVEKVIVNNAANLIVLIMSNNADELHESFLELAGDLAGEPVSKLREQG